jgi:hypothetical protein
MSEESPSKSLDKLQQELNRENIRTLGELWVTSENSASTPEPVATPENPESSASSTEKS